MADNPNPTLTIENNWRKENKRRFKQFNRHMIAIVTASQQQDTINNAEGDFNITEAQLNEIMRQLRTAAYLDIIGVQNPANANSAVEVSQTDNWQLQYILPSYLRGVAKAEQQLGAQGVATQVSMQELQDLFAVSTNEQVAAMLTSTNQLHGETVESIQQTSFTTLIATTERMISQIRNNMDAANDTTPTRELIANLSERVSVANSSGELIASTETTQGFRKGQLNLAAIRQEETGEEIKVRWLTKDDSRVRDLHARWHGKVMTQAEAQANMNKSPWNCRCGFAIESARAFDNDKRNEMFKKEREALVKEVG